MARASPTASGRTGRTRWSSWTRAAANAERRSRRRAARSGLPATTGAWHGRRMGRASSSRPATACAGGYDLSIVAADGSSPATKLLAAGTEQPVRGVVTGRHADRVSGQRGTGNAGLYVADVRPDDALAGGLQGRRIAPDLGPTWPMSFGDELDPAAMVTRRDGAGRRSVHGVCSLEGRWHLHREGRRLRAASADRTGAIPRGHPTGRQLAFHRTVDPSEYCERPALHRSHLGHRCGRQQRARAR